MATGESLREMLERDDVRVVSQEMREWVVREGLERVATVTATRGGEIRLSLAHGRTMIDSDPDLMRGISAALLEASTWSEGGD